MENRIHLHIGISPLLFSQAEKVHIYNLILQMGKPVHRQGNLTESHMQSGGQPVMEYKSLKLQESSGIYC